MSSNGITVLSPHRDDAAFSCGLLLQQCRKAHVVLLNIFTESDYAPYLPEDGSDRVAQVTLARAAEDAAFVASLNSLGAKVSMRDLALRDAPLRRGIATEQVLGGKLFAEEIEALAVGSRREPSPAVVLVPLGVGGHLDHELVREAAVKAWPSHRLVFYEDLPYACSMQPEALNETTRALLPWNCEAWSGGASASGGEKQTMAMFYPSQITVEVAGEMERHAVTYSGRERFYGRPDALEALQAAMSVADHAH